MAQSIQTSKFGEIDTSGRIPVYLTGTPQDASVPALNLGLGFTVNGQEYTFIPEDRIATGSAISNQGRIYPGFLNPQLLSNLKNTSEYVDISGTQFGNFDIGNFIAQNMGGSTKGYLAKKENAQPILDAGVTFYDPSIMGKITGLGSANGQPAYIMPSGNSYLTPDGRIATTTTQLVGWRESGGLGGLGSFLASIDPSSALSQSATKLFQPVEQTVSKNLAQLDKDLSLSQNAPALAAIALSVAAPGVGAAIGQQMIAAGLIPAATSTAVATAIGTGVANAALQVAQGKSAEDALKGAVVGGVAGFAGGQVGDYLVADPGAVKNFVSSTAANMVAGKDPETAAKYALVQSGIQGTADAISQAQAAKYIENLPIPEHLDAGPAPTSADTMAAYPETNPANIQGPPEDIDTTLLDLSQTPTTNQTYTYEDGSTLTVDADGNVISYTDATETPYKGPIETPSSPLTKAQIEGMIKLGLTVAGASKAADAVQNAISSGSSTTQTGFPFTPSDISGWAQPEYTKTWQAPIDLNSLFTTDNLLGGTQWAGLQGNQFANIPQVTMSDFISGLQNGKI